MNAMAQEYVKNLFGGRVLAMLPKGSRLYGLNTETSDYDYTVVVMPTLTQLMGLDKPDVNLGQRQVDSLDVTFMTLRDFMLQVLKGNPNAVEALFATPEFAAKEWEMVQNAYPFLLGRRAVDASFTGFARRELHEMREALEGSGKPVDGKKWRHVCVLMREHYRLVTFGRLYFPLVSADLAFLRKVQVMSVDGLVEVAQVVESQLAEAANSYGNRAGALLDEPNENKANAVAVKVTRRFVEDGLNYSQY